MCISTYFVALVWEKMDRLGKTLEETQKIFEELMRIYNPLSNNTRLNKNYGQKNRPFSKGVHVILQSKHPCEVKDREEEISSSHLDMNCNEQILS